jgi:hypothetical protein
MIAHRSRTDGFDLLVPRHEVGCETVNPQCIASGVDSQTGCSFVVQERDWQRRWTVPSRSHNAVTLITDKQCKNVPLC